MAASTAQIVQAVTRLSSGALYDKLGFKVMFYILMGINTVNSVACYYVRHIPGLYFTCI